MIPTRRPSFALLAFLGMAVLVLAAVPAAAQTATLVRDIRLGYGRAGCDSCPPVDTGSGPSSVVTLGARAVFLATEPSSGTELWVTDGTAAGTRMIEDLCPGPCSADLRPLAKLGSVSLWLRPTGDDYSATIWRSDGTAAGTGPLLVAGAPLEVGTENDGTGDEVLPLASLGGALYAVACNSAQGCGLWRIDGSPGGTRLVAATPSEGSLGRPRAGASKLFFIRYTAGQGELWRSDGTAQGSSALGPLPGGTSYYSFTAAGDRLFFLVEDEGGQELWASDGTAAPRAVTAFQAPEPFGRDLPVLRALGGRLYFVADDVLHGQELWVSDATPAGTRQLTDFGYDQPLGSARESTFSVLGGRLFFSATDGLTGYKLWRTDGTPETTRAVGDFFIESPAVEIGGRLVYRNGYNVWSSDGTAEGTRSLTDLRCCGETALGKVLAGALYFTADGSVWRTDGTPAGTRRFTDRRFSHVRPPEATLGGEVLFPGTDEYGEELWASNGRRDGTRLVANLSANPAGSAPESLVPVGGRVVFAATDGHGRELFASDGTAAGTPLLMPLDNCYGCSFELVHGAGGAAYFFLGSSYSPYALYRTDGTTAGTALVKQFGEGEYLGRVAALGNRAYFTVSRNGVTGTKLWTSDGTAAGTVATVDFPSSYVEVLTAVGSTLYLVTLTDHYTIWASDGTSAGTRKLLEVPEHVGFPGGRTLEFGRAGGTVLFFLEHADGFEGYGSGVEVWKTDGTAAGTTSVAVLDGVAYDARPDELVEVGNALYFTLTCNYYCDDDRVEVWRSDASAAGTVRLGAFGDPRTYGNDPPPSYLTPFAGRLFFAADDGVHGRELWSSDGTAAGTALFRDLNPGADSGEVNGLTAAAGRLFFAAAEPQHGVELWQSDGTAAGTRLAQDIAPLGASSSPASFTVAGDRLFFSADDGRHGRELWSLPLAGAAGCQPSATRLCLGGGRFAVEADWRDFQGNQGSGNAAGLTADTGYFWFFDPANVEVILKVLDARSLNDHFWVFFGALSSVEYSLTVTDTQTGLTRRYFNPSGRLGSVADTQGFGPLGAYGTVTTTAALQSAAAPSLVSARSEPAAATGVCLPAATRLCLNGGRFAVEAAWKDFQSHQGVGQAVAMTGDTGYFWFFNQANVEVVLKVLDGRPVNGKFWLFYGALSNVEYTLTVTDVTNGAVRVYSNPAGRLASHADTGAF